MRTRGFVRDRLCGPVDLNLASNEMAATAVSVTATGTNLVPICANMVPIWYQSDPGRNSAASQSEVTSETS